MNIFSTMIRRYEFEPRSRRDVPDSIVCDKACQWLATGQWFSPGTWSTNKTDHHGDNWNIVEMALNTIDQTKSIGYDKDPLWLLNLNLSMPMQLKADQENSCMHYNIEWCSALLID